MRKVTALLLIFVLLLSCASTAFAADATRDYLFELSVDGGDTKQVQPGDIITVTFNLNRTDSGDSYEMYAMQNEIRYDSEFFRLVEGSVLLSSGISTTDIGLRDNFRELYMNFVSLSGGETWEARRMVGSFQLEVIAASGVSQITNQDYLVSNADGTDSYEADCQDVTVIVSSACTVKFESNGGTEVPSQVVPYGETVARPEDPVREGYRLRGWYSDLDLQNPWDFDEDTVEGNMTLYAGWEKEEAPAAVVGDEDGGSGGSLWWLLGLALLLLVLLILFLLLWAGKKTVRFVTGCEVQIPEQKVKKGGSVTRPEEPERPGRTFAGWYSDEARTVRWDFENDPVRENLTLYAKWL